MNVLVCKGRDDVTSQYNMISNLKGMIRKYPSTFESSECQNLINVGISNCESITKTVVSLPVTGSQPSVLEGKKKISCRTDLYKKL